MTEDVIKRLNFPPRTRYSEDGVSRVCGPQEDPRRTSGDVRRRGQRTDHREKGTQQVWVLGTLPAES